MLPEKVEASGIDYRSIRPDSTWLVNPDAMRRFSHNRWGLLRVGRDWILPALRESYEDILLASERTDLLVSHPLAAYATRLVLNQARFPIPAVLPKMHGAVRTLTALLQLKQLVSVRI